MENFESKEDLLHRLVQEATVPHIPVEEPANPFYVYELGELLRRPPKEYLVRSLFGPSDHCMIFGNSGSGKTLLMIDIAVRGALGLPIAGQFETERPFSTLYCSGEGVGGIAQRFRAACDLHRLEPSSDAFGRIAFIENVPKLFQDDDSEEGIDRFVESLVNYRARTGFDPDVIVLDTLADASIGANENDNGHIALINARVAKIRTALSSASFYLHHTPKTGSGPRGGTAHMGKCDLALEIEGDSGTRVLKCSKSKDAEPFRSLTWRLRSAEPSAVVEWLGADSPTAIGPKDAKRLHIAEIINVLREHAAEQGRARRPKEILDLMEAPPTERQMRDYLKGLREDPGCMVQGIKVPTVDKHNKPNKLAWAYWIDLSVTDE